MPDVRVGEEDAVERTTGLGPAAKRVFRDEVHLPGEVG